MKATLKRKPCLVEVFTVRKHVMDWICISNIPSFTKSEVFLANMIGSLFIYLFFIQVISICKKQLRSIKHCAFFFFNLQLFPYHARNNYKFRNISFFFQFVAKSTY